MKIRFLTNTGYDADLDKVINSSATIDLCGQGRPEGTAEGLLPLKLPGNVVVTPRLQVTSGTTTSKKGVRSAVIKVSLPYTAVKIDDSNAVVTDPSRSQGEVSMHIVIALPRNATADLAGKTGASSASVASAQVVAVSTILRALLSAGLMERGQLESADTGPVTGNLGLYGMKPYEAETEQPILTRLDHVTPVTFDHAGSYGLDLSAVTATAPATQDLTGTLVRIANGLAPLGCHDVLAGAYTNPPL